MVRQTCANLEADEILENLKNNPELEKMKYDRIQEILTEAFRMEQE